MWKKVWSDPVWSKVIAAAIIALASFSAAFFLGLWPVILGWGRLAVDFLASDSTFPYWAVILLGLLSLPFIVLLVVGAWQSVFPAADAGPNWARYTSDMFLGMRWRWSYDGTHMSAPISFCPTCDFQVFPQRGFDYGSHTQIKFHCDNCSSTLGSFDESYDELQSKASRLAQMKIRNDSWQPAGGV